MSASSIMLFTISFIFHYFFYLYSRLINNARIGALQCFVDSQSFGFPMSVSIGEKKILKRKITFAKKVDFSKPFVRTVYFRADLRFYQM